MKVFTMKCFTDFKTGLRAIYTLLGLESPSVVYATSKLEFVNPRDIIDAHFGMERMVKVFVPCVLPEDHVDDDRVTYHNISEMDSHDLTCCGVVFLYDRNKISMDVVSLVYVGHSRLHQHGIPVVTISNDPLMKTFYISDIVWHVTLNEGQVQLLLARYQRGECGETFTFVDTVVNERKWIIDDVCLYIRNCFDEFPEQNLFVAVQLPPEDTDATLSTDDVVTAIRNISIPPTGAELVVSDGTDECKVNDTVSGVMVHVTNKLIYHANSRAADAADVVLQVIADTGTGGTRYKLKIIKERSILELLLPKNGYKFSSLLINLYKYFKQPALQHKRCNIAVNSSPNSLTLLRAIWDLQDLLKEENIFTLVRVWAVEPGESNEEVPYDIIYVNEFSHEPNKFYLTIDEK